MRVGEASAASHALMLSRVGTWTWAVMLNHWAGISTRTPWPRTVCHQKQRTSHPRRGWGLHQQLGRAGREGSRHESIHRQAGQWQGASVDCLWQQSVDEHCWVWGLHPSGLCRMEQTGGHRCHRRGPWRCCQRGQ